MIQSHSQTLSFLSPQRMNRSSNKDRQRTTLNNNNNNNNNNKHQLSQAFHAILLTSAATNGGKGLRTRNGASNTMVLEETRRHQFQLLQFHDSHIHHPFISQQTACSYPPTFLSQFNHLLEEPHDFSPMLFLSLQHESGRSLLQSNYDILLPKCFQTVRSAYMYTYSHSPNKSVPLVFFLFSVS